MKKHGTISFACDFYIVYVISGSFKTHMEEMPQGTFLFIANPMVPKIYVLLPGGKVENGYFLKSAHCKNRGGLQPTPIFTMC